MTRGSPGIRVLLVEDIQAMRRLVRQMLRSLGIHHITEVPDGSAALQHLVNEPVDLIVSDWNMVPMSGLQLLQALRAEPQWSHLPFLMMTGRNQAEDFEAAKAAGVNGYLVKPFGAEALSRQLRRVLVPARMSA